MIPLNSLKRFLQLKAADRGVVLRALVLLPEVRIWLRVIGFKRTRALLSSRRSPLRISPAPGWNPRAWNIMRLMRAAARRGPVHGNCLSQSLTLWALLRDAGIESELRIGVRKDQGKLLAHAWVELAGVPLNDRMEVVRQYAAFETPSIPNGTMWT